MAGGVHPIYNPAGTKGCIMTIKRTDYETIAGTYDQAKIRHAIPPDEHLGACLAHRAGAFTVLDVACGTGNYLRVQRAAYPDSRIRWLGIDASPAMLALARVKLDPAVELLPGRAEKLPLADGAVDYLSCSFVFHHFEDKGAALDEMSRVLRARSGSLRLSNIVPEQMPSWWVYQLFPQAAVEDQKRFWPAERLYGEIERRGFVVSPEIRINQARRTAAELLREAERRDLSSLAIVGDSCFAGGIERLKQGAARGESFLDTAAIMLCHGSRAAVRTLPNLSS